MVGLLSFMLLAAFIGGVVGLIKPTKVRLSSRKDVVKYFGGGLLVIFILLLVVAPKTEPAERQTQVPDQQTNTTSTNTTTAKPVVTQSPEEALKEKVKSVVAQDSTFAFTSMTVDKDEDVKNGKLVTVSVHIEDFFTAKSITRSTGVTASKLAQTIFDNKDLPATYLVVKYNGLTTDNYGKKGEHGIFNYMFDKDTYLKIHWDNFDRANFCEFLREEGKQHGSEYESFHSGCAVLVNIK